MTTGFRNIACLALLLGSGIAPALAQEEIRPSLADPSVSGFDTPNLVYPAPDARPGTNLVVFLPGTNGVAAHAPRAMLGMIASRHIPVIYLSYDDQPSVSVVCPRRGPDCAARMREVRAFGDDAGGPVSNPPQEAITARLTALLRYLAHTQPNAGWPSYLTPDGNPDWPRVTLSGLSQGAGMAAFIAKRVPVGRVVLFSSPWDFYGPGRTPCPWLSTPSATPPERWWAERHVRENTTDAIARAYAALGIPENQILLFDRGLPDNAGHSANPYHGSTVRQPAYAPQWRVLYGMAPG